MKSASEGIDGFVGKLKAAGEVFAAAFAVKELFEFTSGMAEAAVGVEKSAAAFGLSSNEMQRWQLAAKITGVETEVLDNSFKILAKNVGAGAGPGVDALQKLGVSVKDARGEVRPLGELFEDAGAKIGGIENAGKRAAAGQAVFGRQFVKLIPLLSKGKEGMAALRAELDELGGGFDEAFIQKSKDVEGQTARLGQAWTSLRVTIASYLLPAVRWITVEGTKLVKTFIDVAQNTQSVKAGLAILGVAGLAALAPLLPMLASLLIPALALGAAFLLLEDFFTFISGGDSEFGDMLDKMFGPGAADIVRKFFTDIKKEMDDLGIGFSSLGLMADFVWTQIKFSALKTAAEISDAFNAMWGFVLQGAKAVALAAASAVNATGASTASFQTAVDRIDDTLYGKLKNGDKPGETYDPNKKYEREGDGILNGKTDAAEIDRLFQVEMQRIGTAQLAIQNHTDGDVKTENHITIHVPPGTPAQQARAVGDAAAEGASRGAESKRSTHAALNPGKG